MDFSRPVMAQWEVGKVLRMTQGKISSAIKRYFKKKGIIVNKGIKAEDEVAGFPQIRCGPRVGSHN